MRPILLIAALAFRLSAGDCKPKMPCYSAEGIVDGASFARAVAPGSIVSIFGTDLAWAAQGRDANQASIGLGGVHVLVGGLAAFVFYVSPGQVNALIPNSLRPGGFEVRIVRDGAGGPAAIVNIEEYAPALFEYERDTAIALRYPTWQPATREYPARPGEIVSLFATGLGPLTYPFGEYDIPNSATPIEARKQFRVLLNGIALDDNLIEYAGCAPGYIGLYQINVRLPERVDPDPELRIGIGKTLSRADLRLRTAP
ncbi:MAG TPA: hypothetical protein VN428_26160 [Bryobacteraceae bacterium]|nr:hypothetical protein [Bryobacteraceae bacterium]